MKKVASFLFFVLFICGCSTNPEVPEWLFENDNNKAYFIGNGEGTSYEKAFASAVADMTRKISTKIDSDFTVTSTRYNDSYKTVVLDKTRLKVNDITLNEIAVLKNERIRKIYFVRVAISRVELLYTIQKEYENSIQLLKNDYDSMPCKRLTASNKSYLAQKITKINDLKLLISYFGVVINDDDLGILQKNINTSAATPKAFIKFNNNNMETNRVFQNGFANFFELVPKQNSAEYAIEVSYLLKSTEIRNIKLIKIVFEAKILNCQKSVIDVINSEVISKSLSFESAQSEAILGAVQKIKAHLASREL